MPRKRTGQVYVETHGDHWDMRIDLPTGERSKRACLPAGLTKDQAKAEARRLKAIAWAEGARLASSVEVADPAADPAEGETLDVYAERWVSTRRDQREARQHLRFHILPVLGAQRPITSFKREDIEKLVRSLDDAVTAKRIAWKTAINIYGTCTKLFDDATNAKKTELRVLSANPCTNVRGPDRGEERQSAWLFPREAVVLLGCEAVPVRWREAYALALYSGMRQGEIDVLHVADAVLDGGYFSVHKARNRVDDGTKSTKGRRARRVPIEPALRPLVVALTANRDGAERLAETPSHAARELREHLLLAGITRAELHANDEHRRPITYHDLRHTYGTWLALRGESELVIQSRLGHADTAMTQAYIEAAEVVGHGDVGAPFPELPPSLLRPVMGPEEIPPGKATQKRLSARKMVEAAGIESAETASFQQFGAPIGTAPTDDPHATGTFDHVTDAPVGQASESDEPLEEALRLAAKAGQWSVVSALARELEARRLAESPNVVPLRRSR
jgi:integrase